MKAPQRLVWDDVEVFPQHMQQLDLYHENLLAGRVDAIVSYSWGILDLEIDAQALRTGQLKASRFNGILPDGLPISFTSGQPEAPAVRPLEGHFPPSQRSLEVFLGVPREREGVANYEKPTARSGRTRYVATTRSIADSTTENAVHPINFGQPNVSVLFGDESRDDYEAIKIGEVARDSSGELSVSEYVPPVLRIGASSSLISGLRRLLELMVSKQRSLAGARRQRDSAAFEFTASDVTKFLQLSTLNGIVPVLHQMVETGRMPPEQAYYYLLQFAGQLATFAADTDLATLPTFNYTNLRATFDDLFARITSALRVFAKEQHIAVLLELRKNGMLAGRLEDDRLLRSTHFILAVRSEHPEARAIEMVPRIVKVASFSEIDSIVQASAPGVPIQVTYRPPPEIPVRAEVVYFELGTQNAHFKTILSERTIAIYLSPAFDLKTTTVELLVVPPPEK